MGRKGITTMYHLTLTGFDAGRALCDCDKAAELAAGNHFQHAIYAPMALINGPECCPACKAEWDACEPEPIKTRDDYRGEVAAATTGTPAGVAWAAMSAIEQNAFLKEIEDGIYTVSDVLSIIAA